MKNAHTDQPLKRIAKDEHDIDKASDAILEENPGDATAFQCKVVALIKMSRYQEAFDALDSHADDAVDQSFEKAYCLYMLNREEESLKALGDATALAGRSAQLAAQIRQRADQVVLPRIVPSGIYQTHLPSATLQPSCGNRLWEHEPQCMGPMLD